MEGDGAKVRQSVVCVVCELSNLTATHCRPWPHSLSVARGPRSPPSWCGACQCSPISLVQLCFTPGITFLACCPALLLQPTLHCRRVYLPSPLLLPCCSLTRQGSWMQCSPLATNTTR